MLREYECMLILPAEADEAMVGTAVDRIAKIVTPDGGKIGNIDRWGRKRLAYEIARQHEGYYVVVRFDADPATQPELDRTLKLADEVIRHKVLLQPDISKTDISKTGRSKTDRSKTDRSKTAASPASVEA